MRSLSDRAETNRQLLTFSLTEWKAQL
jgi:hypothetical protein